MSALLEGFRTGWGMMTDHLNQQDQKRRNEIADRQNAVTFANNQKLHEQSVKMNDQQIAANDFNANNARIGQIQSALSFANQQKLNNQQSTLNKQSITQNEQTIQQNKNNLAMQNLKVYESLGNWDRFIVDPVFKGTPLENLQTIEGIDSAEGLNDALAMGDKEKIVFNANVLYKPLLNRNVGKMPGRDGATIRDISIADYEIGENGKVKLPVIVTTDNGTYQSYISEMRGIDPDDPDKVFEPEMLLGQIQEYGKLASILKASGVYDKLKNSASALTRQQTGNSDSKQVQTYEYIRSIIGDQGLRDLLQYGKGKNPQEVAIKVREMAQDQIKSDARFMGLTPEEQNQVINQTVTEIMNGIQAQGTTSSRGHGANPYQLSPDAVSALKSIQQDLQQDMQGQ